jgi:membrane protein DedA with SNARE-associated domain
MTLTEYAILFVLVVTTGAGLPGPGDASLIAAGTLAGEGRLQDQQALRRGDHR